ncbi:predicted protein [Chaetomium globosum CBS 148.51]|uniref:Uncharacterized protein n=1 Tax=Chaetomium globosum (strain ATCC 6205 / CBS 148.51 / DSM 1962 / NBRC 6347 / NRRL 1970) TaxID=306901 RepID=Q2H555_CHAGB|nr:uncharacterized protein CHGG_06210 [Chaetomium globosum CBS 148.51]EAQ89591.1 predicted protein [Chaetomium globosum CBS 148.51]
MGPSPDHTLSPPAYLPESPRHCTTKVLQRKGGMSHMTGNMSRGSGEFAGEKVGKARADLAHKASFIQVVRRRVHLVKCAGGVYPVDEGSAVGGWTVERLDRGRLETEPSAVRDGSIVGEGWDTAPAHNRLPQASSAALRGQLRLISPIGIHSILPPVKVPSPNRKRFPNRLPHGCLFAQETQGTVE